MGEHQPRPDRSRAARSAASDASRLDRLRSRPGDPPSNQMVLARIAVRIPAGIWLAPFTRRHPELRLEVMNQTDISPTCSVSDFWISGGPPGTWSSEISGYPDVDRVDCLTELGDGCVYRITFATPPVVAVYRRLGVPLKFPLQVRAGQIYWEVAARETDFRRILDYLLHADPSASVLSLRRRPLRSHLPDLTTSQRTLLAIAMAEGYFAVPRSITLTGLARKLGRSKSSTSESLALIEKKVLESAMRPPPTIA